MQNPSPAHNQAADHCIAYLYQTRNLGLRFGGNSTCAFSDRTNAENDRTNVKDNRTNTKDDRTNASKDCTDIGKDPARKECTQGVWFRCTTDASYGDCAETRQSSEGYTFHLFGAVIDWQSLKQKTVVRSTTEAELLALSKAATQLYWWRRVFQAIGLETQTEDLIECDNAQTVRLLVTDTPRLNTKLRHIDIY